MEARVEKGGEACTKSLEDSGCSEVARQAGFREGPPSRSDRCETSGFDLVTWKEDYAQVGESFRIGEAGRMKTEYQDLAPKVYAVSRIIGAKQRSEHSQAESLGRCLLRERRQATFLLRPHQPPETVVTGHPQDQTGPFLAPSSDVP